MTKIYEFEYVKLGYGWINGNSTTEERLQGTVKDTGFTLNWAAKDIGFGQLTFVKHGKKTICETETMSRDFISQAVGFWLKSLEYQDI